MSFDGPSAARLVNFGLGDGFLWESHLGKMLCPLQGPYFINLDPYGIVLWIIFPEGYF